MNRAHKEAQRFVERLAACRFSSVFNPYTDECLEHDGDNAAEIRRKNLSQVLSAALENGVDSLWIARDLGYRGGRRTGLALTDELHLDAHAKLFGVAQLARSTKGPALAERTATVIWQAVAQIERPVFFWNVFPFHPHEAGDPMSNRCHTREEREACAPLLSWLIEELKPKSILAIGRDAQIALADAGIEATQVRHPSYGGQAEFKAGVLAHYAQGPRRATRRLH